MPPKPRIRVPTSAANVPRRAPSAPRPYREPPPRTRPTEPTKKPIRTWEKILSIWAMGAVPFTLKVMIPTGIALLCIRDYVVSIDTVRGSSMAPTLSPMAHEGGKHEFVVIDRRFTELGPGKIQRGDIITFWKPHRPGEISIKRVIGLPGDTLYPARGYAKEVYEKRLGLCDGLPEDDPDAIRDEEAEKGQVVVPWNHVWVEGDNWRRSYDSNDFGPVSMRLIDGKARKVFRGWGMQDIGDGRKEERTKVIEGHGAAVPAAFAD